MTRLQMLQAFIVIFACLTLALLVLCGVAAAARAVHRRLRGGR